MNILITGANSFIGSYFQDQYASIHNINEVCLKENKPENIDFSGFDVVLHVAAIVHSSKYIKIEEYRRVNSTLAFEIARKAKNDGVKQFVFLSSIKVFGEKSLQNKPFNESSECNPGDGYSISKLEAEEHINKLNDEKYTVTIIRPSVVYGPNVKANILSLIKFINQSFLIPFDKINNIRSFVYIGNLCFIISKLIEQRKKGVYIAADLEKVSTSELSREIALNLNKRRYFLPLPFAFILKSIFPNKIGKIYDSFSIDNSYTLKTIGEQLPYSFKQGIKETIDWFKITNLK